MRRSPFVLLLALAAAGCESPTQTPEPRAMAGEALLPASAVVEKASGTAYRFPLSNGVPVTVRVHFNATNYGDGTTRGFYTYDAGSTSLAVDVTCMTVVEGNKAWIAGVITESSIGFVGHVSYFYTFDNGEGDPANPDIISLVRVETQPGLGEAARFCDELPTVLPPRDVERGNVNVSSSAGL